MPDSYVNSAYEMLKHGTEDILALQNVQHFAYSRFIPELIKASYEKEEEKAQPEESDKKIKGPPQRPPSLPPV